MYKHLYAWQLCYSLSGECIPITKCYTVKSVLRDHCHERPPVLKDQIFLVDCPTFQWQCHKRSPVLWPMGVVLQERLYCNQNIIILAIMVTISNTCYLPLLIIQIYINHDFIQWQFACASLRISRTPYSSNHELKSNSIKHQEYKDW